MRREAHRTFNKTEAALIQTYQTEIALVEEIHQVEIDCISEDALELLKDEAIQRLDDDTYDFVGLMDALSIVFAEQKILREYEDLPSTRANDVVVDNLTSRTLHRYGALVGKYNGDIAATGTDVTETRTIGLSVGGVLHGVTLTVQGSYSAEITLHGPDTGATLYNGSHATARIACAILHGTITETTWDLVDRQTGEVKSSHRSCQIPMEPSDFVPYTTLVKIDPSLGVWQADSLDPDVRRTGIWANDYLFEQDMEDAPYKVASGSTSATCPICGAD